MNLSVHRPIPTSGHPGLSLRPLAITDSSLVFDWRNTPSIVAMSSSRQLVTREEHERWIASCLAGTPRLVFVIGLAGQPAGLLRFDGVDTTEAEISVYLMPAFVGRGAGTAAIRAGCDLLAAGSPVIRVLAWIREENERSKASFAKAGFRPASGSRPGQVCWEYRISPGEDRA